MERVSFLIVFCIFKEEKRTPAQEGKVTLEIGRKLKSSSLYLVIPCPLFFFVVFLIRFKKQNNKIRERRFPEEEEGRLPVNSKVDFF